jgi:hypothetical protein
MSAAQVNRKFYSRTPLAILFSLEFVNMGFPVYRGTVIKGAGAAGETVPGCPANRGVSLGIIAQGRRRF